MANPSVALYLAQRLSDLGIDRVFGVPGDYAFSFDDAVEECASLKWVACANELNASYAADGYARRFGAAILSTTYGVGELSALNGVMGCYTERVPVFHVVGAPSRRITHQKLITHHTHGDGVFGNFEHLSQSACCVSAVLTPANAISEIERVIHEALKNARPAYIVVPMDSGKIPVIGTPVKGAPIVKIQRQIAVPSEVEAAADGIMGALKAAKNPLVLPSMLLQRYGLKEKLADFLNATNLPFALTPMDKGLANENHPGFVGMYKGGSSTPPSTQDIVESADLILDLGGVVFEDLNTGLWSSNLTPERMIKVSDTWVQVGHKVWIDTALSEVLDALIAKSTKFASKVKTDQMQPLALKGVAADTTNSENFYPRLQRMLRQGDVLVAETGTCMIHLGAMQLPDGVDYESQMLWGSIGWGTPASLGVAMANKEGRTVLVTGDGSHQLTYNEIGVMGRYNPNLVIFVLNNGIYGIEDVLSEMGHEYDDLAYVDYHKVPEAMGCKNWITAKVTTVGELDAVITRINQANSPAYVEVMIPASESAPKSEDIKDRAYKLRTPAA